MAVASHPQQIGRVVAGGFDRIPLGGHQHFGGRAGVGLGTSAQAPAAVLAERFAAFVQERIDRFERVEGDLARGVRVEVRMRDAAETELPPPGVGTGVAVAVGVEFEQRIERGVVVRAHRRLQRVPQRIAVGARLVDEVRRFLGQP